jgi:hypothetical protein
MYKDFTGYIVKEDYDLNNLEEYGFWKTEPKDINPWWQRPFNMKWDFIGTWDCELLVNRDDRKLYRKCDDGCNMDKLNDTLEKMKQDDIFINI